MKLIKSMELEALLIDDRYTPTIVVEPYNDYYYTMYTKATSSVYLRDDPDREDCLFMMIRGVTVEMSKYIIEFISSNNINPKDGGDYVVSLEGTECDTTLKPMEIDSPYVITQEIIEDVSRLLKFS